MGFKRDEVSDLLVAVHRRCSICHRFCGTKIETDHIVPGADEGTDNIDNAIPVCLSATLRFIATTTGTPAAGSSRRTSFAVTRRNGCKFAPRHPACFSPIPHC